MGGFFQISHYFFLSDNSDNLSTTGISWGIGFYFGGIPGFGTGVFFTYTSTLYDGFNSFTNQMGIKMSDFNQSTINGILRK